ncbi:MAG: DNA polymerase III subunit delta' [Nocardioidaceae bacterium]|nr:DNA polymerase III subunit delta' [Nocardioidaceae bacterium]
MSVWDDLIGQEELVASLQVSVAAAASALKGERSGAAMTHAWLFTGPPGSGRSNAARAFAAALQCERGGCGECLACRTTVAGSNADVTSLITEQSVIRTDAAREAVRMAALSPANRRWQIMIVEDADRLHERAADALLKSLEEPAPRTVWLLCAPTVQDVVPTIRSRCRPLVLRTPPTAAVADYLVRRDRVPSAVATFAARASQGHIGRARALARDEATRNRRREVLRIPTQLSDLGSCMTSAANLSEAATEEAKPRSDTLDAKELADLELAYGGGRGGQATGFAAARKELQRDQKQRAKRLVKDSIDRSLLDLASFYRDVVAVQLGAVGGLVNEELRQDIDTLARATSGEVTTQRLGAIFNTRELLETEVAPLLALESLMISLRGAPTQ